MANNHTINEFKQAFRGGSRANRFIVNAKFPSGVYNSGGALRVSKFTIVSASLPKLDIGVIGVPYRGRMAYYAGDRQYSVWPITVYDDNNNYIWSAMQSWKELLDGHITHRVYQNNYSYSNLQVDWEVEQLDNNGGTIRKIKLHRCWPSEISGINFDMGSSEFVSFQTTLTFDHISYLEGI